MAASEKVGSFTYGLECSRRIGASLRSNALFREAQVRKYKKKLRDARERLHDAGSKCDNRTPAARALLRRRAAEGLIAQEPFVVGTQAYDFEHSWPDSVALVSAEPNVDWRAEVSSQHCPFCKPRGYCESVRELIDHLESHHPDFNYRARRESRSAVEIKLKCRDSREKDVDPMYIVGSEGCYLSPRMIEMSSNYESWQAVNRVLSRRREQSFPFVVLSKKVPASYGGFRAGAPGTIDSVPVAKAAARLSLGSADAPAIPEPVELSLDGLENDGALRKSGRQKARLSNGIGGGAQSDSMQRVGKAKASKSALPSVEHTRKRKLRNDPHGIENMYTRRLRDVMFGRDAANRMAGGGAPRLTQAAAQGVLYHSVTNKGLDVERFNSGYDSDADADTDTSWRLQLADEQLQEMVDMLPIEKYFFSLWNQFVTSEFSAKDDRRAYPAWKAFVAKYGGEVRRMRMEAILQQNLVLCWEMGIMDAQGVRDVLHALRDRPMEDVKQGVPHPDFAMALRLLSETRDPLRHVYTPTAQRRARNTCIRDESMNDWLRDQQLKMKRMERIFDDAPEGWRHPQGPLYLRRSLHSLLKRDPSAATSGAPRANGSPKMFRTAPPRNADRDNKL